MGRSSVKCCPEFQLGSPEFRNPRKGTRCLHTELYSHPPPCHFKTPYVIEDLNA